MEIIICEDYEALSNKAFAIMREVLVNPKAVLGLATGSTPVGLYKNMVASYQNKEISFKDITTFNLDEYANLDVNNEQSYYSFMKEHLFSHVDINLANVNLPNGMGDLDKNCQEYEKKLAKYQIDIQVLGIGRNGHIGFNEPGSSFDSVTHVEKLTEKTRQDNARFFENDINKVPTHACTMGLKTIMQSKKILF